MSTPTTPPIRPRGVAATLRYRVVPRPGQTPNLFGASATLLSIAAVYCYFVGYIFSYFLYYRGFGVTLESLDLSPQFYFIRAYTALDNPGGLLALTLLVLVIGAYLGGKVRTGILLAVLAAAFPLLFRVSAATARSERTRVYCSPSISVSFEFHDDPVHAASADSVPAVGHAAATPLPADPIQTIGDPATVHRLLAMSRDNLLAPLLETKDRIVVFRIPNCRQLGGPPAAQIYTLLRSDLKFINTTVP